MKKVIPFILSAGLGHNSFSQEFYARGHFNRDIRVVVDYLEKNDSLISENFKIKKKVLHEEIPITCYEFSDGIHRITDYGTGPEEGGLGSTFPSNFHEEYLRGKYQDIFSVDSIKNKYWIIEGGISNKDELFIQMWREAATTLQSRDSKEKYLKANPGAKTGGFRE